MPSKTHPQSIGPYRVESELGRGGMGVVYLARDPRLDRQVAIKALPDDVAADPDRLEHFTREARLLASLNHPHIASVHGMEDAADGTRYLVLEHIDGETLADRLVRGALPPADALRVSGEIAAALEFAHERGVIHRDLKPGNIMITSKGAAKVLDFGLARRGASQVLETGLAVTVSNAGKGEFLGTPGYMSPEQIRAEPEDKRTDIFAFGCVLYEALAGRRAFGGANMMDAVGATLDDDPDWNALPDGTPAAIVGLLRRCLAKDPHQRLRDIGDARLEIESARGSGRPPAVAAPTPAGAQAPAWVERLPRRLTSFIGRERELGDCLRLLQHTRLLVLTGVGGCGKSRLMVRVAESLLGEFPDGVFFADLAPLTDPDRVPGALAAALDVREEPDKPMIDTLKQQMRERRALLLLDNCEQVLTATGKLSTEMLQACGRVKILATSREPMGISGEQTFPVPPLALPAHDGESSPDALRDAESVRLFLDRASAAQPSFDSSPRNTATIAEICRRLDGMPLAIELAAARAKILSVEEILSRLNDRFRLLTGGGRGALPRHQTLRATIQWSYDLLTDEERSLFRALAVFAGGWTLEAVGAIWGESTDEFAILDALTRLVDKSMVTVDRTADGVTRYRFLETVRQYALEKLIESEDGATARDRHLAHFLAFAETAEPGLVGADQALWLSRLEQEHENLLGSLHWSDQVPDGAPLGLRMAGALFRFWYIRGSFALGRDVLLRELRRPGAERPSPERAKALNGAGTFASLLGDHAAARQLLEECLAVARAIGESRLVARTLNSIGMMAAEESDKAAARAYFAESLEICRKIGEKRGAGVALNNLGDLAFQARDYAVAGPLLEEGLVVLQESGDRLASATALANLAWISLRSGDPETARRRAAESLRITIDLESKLMGAGVLEVIAELAVTVGDAEAAGRFLGAVTSLQGATGEVMRTEEQQIHEATTARVRAALGKKACAALVAEGGGLSFEAATERASAWLRER